MSMKSLITPGRAGALLRAAMLCATTLGLASCASSGNGKVDTLTVDDAQRIIVVGKSTKADVKAAFGSADVIPFASGDEVWVYQASSSGSILKSLPVAGRLAGDDGKFRELKIVFGKDNVVKKFQLQDTLQPQPTPQ